MLKINKKLTKNGFSLIELMIAVAILAMAIFGIFHAYSVGFMGMADARDRTVATNYAREAMEDIKNMDFLEIDTQERTAISGNTKYEREVIVQHGTNLKSVTSKVYWQDRNGTWKIVETDMVIHFIETTAGNPTRIMLYADPYNVLVLDPVDYPTNTYKYISTITAVIKDAIGNTVTTWNENIAFSLTGSGTLSSNAVTPDNFENGKAIITFTSGISSGEVTITASTEGLAPDSVTINVYNPDVPVKINLTNFFPPNVEEEILFMIPGSESRIRATIVDAGGDKVAAAEHVITFNRTGPGTLSPPAPTEITAINGYAEITLTSTSGTPGTITITASAIGLEPGVVDVITGGQITLSASPIEVPKDEQSVITVTTKDVNGVLINYTGTINLIIDESSTGSGILPPSVTFNGTTSSKEVIFTANSEGTVEITATDPNAILLNSDILTLTVIEELTPHHIIVYAMPLSIPAGGTETLITAKVMAEGNVKITSYTNDITFTTTAGSFSFSDDTVKSITLINGNENYNDGIATVELYSSDITETAEITVSSTVSVVPEHIITGSTEVGFYIGPDHIILSAVPQNISAGGQTCIVTAKIVDYEGTVISDYNEDIGFSISPWPNTIKFLKATTAFLTQKFKKGITTVILKSVTDAGTAVIVAYSEDIFASLNIPVGIALNLVNSETSPSYDPINGIVNFDIEIQGAELILEEMQVSWSLNETLEKIVIQSPDTVDPVTIFNNIENPALSGDIINVDDIILSTGISNVKIYFNQDMPGKTIIVIFNPNSGNYSVTIAVPAT